jgi:hypothetical protein
MELEDSRNALFWDPNAYIQNFGKIDHKESEIKKVVFQEPYETLPNFYVNNNFIKHNCECADGKKFSTGCVNNKHYNCNCNREKQNHHDNCCDNTQKQNDCSSNNGYCGSKQQIGFGFDFKSLLPFMGMFNGGANFGQIGEILNNKQASSSLLSSLFSNKDLMSGILNMLKGGELFNRNNQLKKELKTTDFEIKNYTKVE